MEDITEGFRVGERLIPWGTTREQAVRMLGLGEGALRRYEISLPCPFAYGLPALSVRFSGPAADRPVLNATYDLADIGGLRPVDWADAVESLLGSPGKISRHEPSGSAPAENTVVLNADWSRGDVRLGMWIYGAPHSTDRGRSVGSVQLSWREEVAAEPYLAEWMAQCERLAEAAATLSGIQVYALDWPASPRYGYGLSGKDADTQQRVRFLRHSLHAPEVLTTPSQVARRLSPSQFAVWTSRSGELWSASTRWDTRAFPIGKPVTIDRVEILPAKGAGYSALEIGPWYVRSHQGSREIARAAEQIGSFPGVRIERHEAYDC